MNVARLNMSHGDYNEHGTRLKNVRAAADITGKTVGVFADLQGPKIRLGTFVNDERIASRYQLRSGDCLRLGEVELQLTDPELKSRDRVIKKSEKDSLYAAIDVASVWLERALSAR